LEDAYREHGPGLARYLTRITGEGETALDLVQDTFARALRSPSVPVQSGEIRFWLYKIASNLGLDYLRRRRRRWLVPLTSRHPTPDHAGRHEDAELIGQCLGAIAPEQAVVLLLRLHQGFSTRETAEVLNIGDEAVRSRLARGRLNFVAAYRRLERTSR
jgi:RNA polymerase sigma-70 factor (ECF subfamily)